MPPGRARPAVAFVRRRALRALRAPSGALGHATSHANALAEAAPSTARRSTASPWRAIRQL